MWVAKISFDGKQAFLGSRTFKYKVNIFATTKQPTRWAQNKQNKSDLAKEPTDFAREYC